MNLKKLLPYRNMATQIDVTINKFEDISDTYNARQWFFNHFGRNGI